MGGLAVFRPLTAVALTAGVLTCSASGGDRAVPPWIMTDLGTLGGRFSMALDVNDSGDVVGTSRTAAGERHVFLWRRGHMVDLGRFGGDNAGGPVVVNARGDVLWNQGSSGVLWSNGSSRRLGFYAVALSDAGHVAGNRDRRAVVWKAGRLTVLGILPGDVVANAAGVNAAGDVVGDSFGPRGTRAFLWHAGRVRALTVPGFRESRAVAVNRAGHVLGTASGIGLRSHAFVWRAGVVRDLGVLEGQWSNATALSDRGFAIGQSRVGGLDRAFIWRGGRLTELGTLGGRRTFASSLSDDSLVVGASQTKAGAYHAFVWQSGRMTDLGRPGRISKSDAVAVSNAGHVVGYTQLGQAGDEISDAPQHAVVWTRSRR